jgi:hypothetical protein
MPFDEIIPVSMKVSPSPSHRTTLHVSQLLQEEYNDVVLLSQCLLSPTKVPSQQSSDRWGDELESSPPHKRLRVIPGQSLLQREPDLQSPKGDEVISPKLARSPSCPPDVLKRVLANQAFYNDPCRLETLRTRVGQYVDIAGVVMSLEPRRDIRTKKGGTTQLAVVQLGDGDSTPYMTVSLWGPHSLWVERFSPGNLIFLGRMRVQSWKGQLSCSTTWSSKVMNFRESKALLERAKLTRLLEIYHWAQTKHPYLFQNSLRPVGQADVDYSPLDGLKEMQLHHVRAKLIRPPEKIFGESLYEDGVKRRWRMVAWLQDTPQKKIPLYFWYVETRGSRYCDCLNSHPERLMLYLGIIYSRGDKSDRASDSTQLFKGRGNVWDFRFLLAKRGRLSGALELHTTSKTEWRELDNGYPEAKVILQQTACSDEIEYQSLHRFMSVHLCEQPARFLATPHSLR